MRDRRWDGGVKATVKEYYHIQLLVRDEKQERRFRAVRDAIATTERQENGEARLRLLKALYWPGTHTIEGAALTIPCSVRTAKYWVRSFLSEVERNLDLP